MALAKTYNPSTNEPWLENHWQEEEIYHFDPNSHAPVYSIDTPPPTVSGHLHLGHVYSYSHADFIARFRRMRGENVFYPMGYDDNGLPTERLVEKRLKITAQQVGRARFIEACLKVSEEAEKDYRALWGRLGLSIDWRYTYRTIDVPSRAISQRSFLALHRQGLVYRKSAPAIWCPECHTSIAQAELNDLERSSEFVTLVFSLPNDQILPIATTRPELLAACVAVFVHPEDARYRELIGQTATVPFYRQQVPILADPAADPSKGTGAVMCCTFGDQTDVAWWFTHNLLLVEAIDRQGCMTAMTGPLAGLPIGEARNQVKSLLSQAGLILDHTPTTQSLRVHERCDTPVEYIIAQQWFVRVLDHKQALQEAGAKANWVPDHMHARYQAWVENLNWDWCLSRQRYYGVPFPVWYCMECGAEILAEESRLPVDPLSDMPQQPCPNCGSIKFQPEEDVMDTWATSSLSPQIVGQELAQPELYSKVFPFSLRPQAHEIIRTWAFYTIVKSHFQYQAVPWRNVLISGWGLAGEGMGKISKSRGGGPMAPGEMIERYSADAVRYWAASTSPGKDSIISEEKIRMGGKLAIKLWNVARFSQSFLSAIAPQLDPASFTAADRWILSRLQGLVEQCTIAFDKYEYSQAKTETENFFWAVLADNYLEMAKLRLYSPTAPGHGGATFVLYHTLKTVLKLFAPFLPYVTDAIFCELFATAERVTSIHISAWPDPVACFRDPQAETVGELLVAIATAVRRYKSDHNLSLGTELNRVQLAPDSPEIALSLTGATGDLMSVTRARQVEVAARLSPRLIELSTPASGIKVGIEPLELT